METDRSTGTETPAELTPAERRRRRIEKLREKQKLEEAAKARRIASLPIPREGSVVTYDDNYDSVGLYPEARAIVDTNPAWNDRLVKRTYVLEKKIGQGGLGEVWRATAREDGKTYAIKFGVHAAREMLVWIQVYATLEDRNLGTDCVMDIVGPAGKDVETEQYFLPMPLMAATLRDLMKSNPENVLDEQDTRKYGAQILRALEKIHRAGFVHLDIKPENLMLPQESGSDLFIRMRAVDYGNMRRTGETAMRKMGIPGTPGYWTYDAIAHYTPLNAWVDIEAAIITIRYACTKLRAGSIYLDGVRARPSNLGSEDKLPSVKTGEKPFYDDAFLVAVLHRVFDRDDSDELWNFYNPLNEPFASMMLTVPEGPKKRILEDGEYPPYRLLYTLLDTMPFTALSGFAQ